MQNLRLVLSMGETMRPIRKEKAVSVICPRCNGKMTRIEYCDFGLYLQETYKCSSCKHTSRVKSRLC